MIIERAGYYESDALNIRYTQIGYFGYNGERFLMFCFGNYYVN